MGITNIWMHDLRRTLGSYMAIGGSSLLIIGKTLTHKSQVSTAIYARLSQEPVLDAINKAVTLIKNSNILKLFRENVGLTMAEEGPIHFSSFLN